MIFEHDTRAGRAFDVLLIVAILVSVAVVMLDTVQWVASDWHRVFRIAEWIFTILFTIEYVLRLLSVHRASTYALSFLGIVDLLSILPTYLSLVLPGGQYLIVIRILRVVRVFRVLKLVQYVGEAGTLGRALRASRYKITVFLIVVLSMVVIVGAVMYLLEGPAHGFTSIPTSVYWAIVTLTTVGYGDISPQTPAGQILAAALMIMGYAILAVPTGIVSVELAYASRATERPPCPVCGTPADSDAHFCKRCGNRLTEGDRAGA
ncbi:MAG: ion transporter [Gemmatimonadota bacterium]